MAIRLRLEFGWFVVAKKKNPFGADYQVYLDSLKKFIDPVAAAEKAGIDYEDIARRRKDDSLFAEAEIIAEEQGAIVNERSMRQLALGGDFRAVQFMEEKRKALDWRKDRGSKELLVEDGKRRETIATLINELNRREELYEEEVNIES